MIFWKIEDNYHISNTAHPLKRKAVSPHGWKVRNSNTLTRSENYEKLPDIYQWKMLKQKRRRRTNHWSSFRGVSRQLPRASARSYKIQLPSVFVFVSVWLVAINFCHLPQGDSFFGTLSSSRLCHFLGYSNYERTQYHHINIRIHRHSTHTLFEFERIFSPPKEYRLWFCVLCLGYWPEIAQTELVQDPSSLVVLLAAPTATIQ